MSFVDRIQPIKSEGKDQVIFATRENHKSPSTVKITDRPEDREPGPILPNGEINWSCPCLGGLASGPCAVDFREAFSCFHFSKAEPKGSDCLNAFMGMHKCMQQYPELYKDDDEELPSTNNQSNDSEISSKMSNLASGS